MKNVLITLSKLLRIKQWIKNVLIFAPLIFSFKLFQKYDFLKTILIFFSFSFVSVLVYIVNDIHDRQQDAIHPEKKSRPIASGKIKPATALIFGLIFFLAGIAMAWFEKKAILVFLFYVFINLFYTFCLKQTVILDVFIIALGFCLRVIIGAIVINVTTSQWILSTTFAISLLLGFGKRRHELLSLKREAPEHREILGEYTAKLLDMMISISAAITTISYIFYTMEAGNARLFYTFPLVLYGVFRYLFLIYGKSKGGKPEDDLFTDRGILFTILLWSIMIIGILYFPELFRHYL